MTQKTSADARRSAWRRSLKGGGLSKAFLSWTTGGAASLEFLAHIHSEVSGNNAIDRLLLTICAHTRAPASIAQLESARMRVRFIFCPSLLLWLLLTVNSSSGSRRSGNTCIRQPEGVERSKTSGDNGYRLKISGNPQKYFPGEVYTGTW